MIDCHINGSKAEVTISGKDFSADLDRFKNAIEREDRTFDHVKNLWTVSNPEKYEHVNFIGNAFRCQQMQLPLFQEV